MAQDVIDDGIVYCAGGDIVAVTKFGQQPPAGFINVERIDTRGTIYPGLIDLHNHLEFNALPLWVPEEISEDRRKWQASGRYKREVRAVMEVLRKHCAAAVIRYVEAKALVGGTTSAQGMKIKDRGYHRGAVRNFERPGDERFPAVDGEIFDLDPDNEARIRRGLEAGRFFHHLAEGIPEKARPAYLRVRDANLIGPNYVGIHCLGLEDGDFGYLARKAGSVVWSPTSNGILYGRTLSLRALVESGARWGLGSDWSPSGPKNLLGEMKVARLAARHAGVSLSSKRIVEAVTIRAAEIVGWENRVGRIAPGFAADMVVVKNRSSDPYENLIAATEREIALVIINGVPRYGEQALMRSCGVQLDQIEHSDVGGKPSSFYLQDADSLPQINEISLGRATWALHMVMSNLRNPPDLADVFKEWNSTETLVLEVEDFAAGHDGDGRPQTFGHLPFLSAADYPPPESVDLDRIATVDDPGFFDRLESISWAAEYLHGLRSFYFPEHPPGANGTRRKFV